MLPTVLRNRVGALLIIASLYFIIWSLLIICFPTLLSSVVIDASATTLIFWDFMGLITLVLGIGLLIAAFNPFRHWPVILLVSLFHIAMIVGFLWGYSNHYLNTRYFPFLFFNHVIWLIPNAYVLYQTYQRNFTTDEMLIDTFNSVQFPLGMFDSTSGENIGDLSDSGPLMLIFLRHFGCPFCKDSLIGLAQYRKELEAKGIRIVLVYMTDEHTAYTYLEKYDLQDLVQVSDPEEIFYKSFRLRKGRFTQLFGLKVWMRWIELGWKKKLFNTKPEGDVTQMPGIFLLENGKVVEQYVHRSVADIPDYSRFLNHNA